MLLLLVISDLVRSAWASLDAAAVQLFAAVQLLTGQFPPRSSSRGRSYAPRGIKSVDFPRSAIVSESTGRAITQPKNALLSFAGFLPCRSDCLRAKTQDSTLRIVHTDKGLQFGIGEVVNGEYRVRAVEADEKGRIIHKVRGQLLLPLAIAPGSAQGCRVTRMSFLSTRVATGSSAVPTLDLSEARDGHLVRCSSAWPSYQSSPAMPSTGAMQPTGRIEVQFGNDIFTYVVYVSFLTVFEGFYCSACSGRRSGKRTISARGRFRKSKVGTHSVN